ncbi:TOG array regulator of axonemal microtubules protein 1 [Rhinatrema bivittatum]|uniref:TOG array regulator of axonemal microtubules protein 1 n=1 Tax=Rhinatrema bivittatum TaxID=194408 RepID=UPI0011273A7B|nr:TOG array regulator of axonemal microtubules protein 1 [Rhinatrema bivittatum]
MRESRGDVLMSESRRSPAAAAAATTGPLLPGWFEASPSPAMDEDAILQHLSAARSPGEHSQLIQALRTRLLHDGGKLLFQNRAALSAALGRLLADGGREVKTVCVQLLAEILRGSERDLDAFRFAVLPELVWNLRDESPALRQELLQTLRECLRHSERPQDVLRALLEHGLESAEPALRTATALAFPLLLSPDVRPSLDLYEVALALAKKLRAGGEAAEEPPVLSAALEHVRQYVGPERFGAYTERFPSSVRRNLSGFLELQPEPKSALNGLESPDARGSRGGPLPATAGTRVGFPDASYLSHFSKSLSNLKFGVIPQELYSRLLDHEDYKIRTQAIEELKTVTREFSFGAAPSSSVVGFISFLYNLLDDINFNVVHGTLEVLNLLVVQLGQSIEQYLGHVISATVKVLGDNKEVIKLDYMDIFQNLMKMVGPQRVLSLLLENLKHKTSRVREEVVNISIVSLLTYPSEDFDLARLSCDIAPALIDSKRKVRHAALEAFAVLASSMGSNKTSLLKAVDSVELHDDGDGVMNAVQARLARKSLPKLTRQGLVEYAIPSPSSAQARGASLLPGADTDWLLAGNRTQSAQSNLDNYGLQSYRSHPDPLSDQTISSRRVLSAGKGKNKFPWENESPGSLEVYQGNQMPVTKDVEQFSPHTNFLQSPKLRPSQVSLVGDEWSFTRKRASRNMFQNPLDFNADSSTVGTGFVDSHQPCISGKWGQLGFSQLYGRSGSVDSDLQFLGTNRQDKASVFVSLNPSNKTHRANCSLAERTFSFPGSNSSQGAFILPSYPLSSPGSSPKHNSLSAGSLKKGQEQALHFSHSWPLNVEGQSKSSTQRRLSSQKSVDATGDHSQEKHSPVPLKPALVKSPSTRRGLNGKKPVPPIPRGTSPLPDKVDIDIIRQKREEVDSTLEYERNKKLTIDLSELSARDEEADHEEMMSSLRSLHNSAAKRRARLSGSASDLKSPDSGLKLDLTPDSSSRASSPNTCSYSESGVYSQESLTSPVSPIPQGKKIMSDVIPPFESKLRLGRVPSARTKGSHLTEHNPSTGGTIFQDKASSEVSIVGQRMAYGNGTVDFEDEAQKEVVPSAVKGQIKEQQKYLKHTKGFTGSTSSLQQLNNLDSMSTSTLADDSVVIVGKGLTVGGDVVIKSKTEPLSIENVNFSCIPLKRNSSVKKTKHSVLPNSGEISPSTRGQYKDQTLSFTHSPEIMDPLELRPFSKPDMALAEALRLLADDDWEKKIEGLNFIRCLSAYHSDVITAKLHETNLAVIQEVKNLRSGVSRAAVVCLGDMFTHLKKNMDQELDNTVKVLLHKASESNTFIREDVDKALNAMVQNVTPGRTLCALINGGLSHLHTAVRKCTAQHLSDVVERMGPGRILSGIKDVTDRALPAVIKFAMDGSQETRYYGRKMLFLLMYHPDFNKMLDKYVQPKDLPYIKETVNHLRQKGLGEMPLDTPSAKGRRSHPGNVGNTRSSSISRDTLSVTEREIGEVQEITRKVVPRNSFESAEYVKVITSSLNAKDFRDRIDGIKQLLSDCETNQDLIVTNIVKIFDAFKSRLHDPNSKVNLVALDTMQKIVPLLKDNLSAVINMLIPAIVDNNLNSKIPGIYAAATNVIQALTEHLDNYLLLQPFCAKIPFLSGKAKQDMTEKLADFVMKLYPRKPYAVEQKVLVVLWHLLGNLTNSGSLPGAGGNMRTATAKLTKALFEKMGQNLLNQAASQPVHIRRNLEEFLERCT